MIFQQLLPVIILIVLFLCLSSFRKKEKFPLINLNTEPRIDWATYIQLLKTKEDENGIERKSMFPRIREESERRNQKDPA